MSPEPQSLADAINQRRKDRAPGAKLIVHMAFLKSEHPPERIAGWRDELIKAGHNVVAFSYDEEPSTWHIELNELGVSDRFRPAKTYLP